MSEQFGGSISVAEREVKDGQPFDQAAQIAHATLSVTAEIPTVREKFNDGPRRRTARELERSADTVDWEDHSDDRDRLSTDAFQRNRNLHFSGRLQPLRRHLLAGKLASRWSHRK